MRLASSRIVPFVPLGCTMDRVMNPRAARAALAVAAIVAGCQTTDDGPGRSPTPAEASAEVGIGRLLTGPSRLEATTVFLLLGRDREAGLTTFGPNEERTTAEGGTVRRARGDCRIVLEGLSIVCREYTVKVVEPDGAGDPIEVLAVGEVVLTGPNETSRASLLRADAAAITLEGEVESNVEYRVGGPASRP